MTVPCDGLAAWISSGEYLMLWRHRYRMQFSAWLTQFLDIRFRILSAITLAYLLSGTYLLEKVNSWRPRLFEHSRA